MTASDPANAARERIQEWLASSTNTDTVVRTIMDGFWTLRTEDQILASRELVGLIGDADYEELRRLLLDPRTSAETKAHLFQDALHRSDMVKLPLLLAVMQQPGHPQAAEAREVLAVILGADFGDRMAEWQARVEEAVRGM